MRSSLLTVALLSAACTTTTPPDDDATARTEKVLCSRNYNSVVHLAEGGTMTYVEVRAELQVELAPTEVQRVTATACDLDLLPTTADCAAGFSCAQRPRPTCLQVPAGLTDDGLLTATCGQRTERRDNQNVLVAATSNYYKNVTFALPQM
jgi:hypothetical protein